MGIYHPGRAGRVSACPMRNCLFAAGALLLAGCAARPSRPAAPDVTLSLQPQAEAAYNIVWLRATVLNRGPGPLRLLGVADTVETACAPAASLRLRALTPSQDTAFFCQRCLPQPPSRRVRTLRAGQQLTIHFQVDFNRVFPNAVSDSARNCTRYNNRTLGNYRFFVQLAGGARPAQASSLVTVYRKQ